MSHITKVKTEIKDLEMLKKACEAIGLKFNENQTSYRWYRSQKNKCDHAISIPNNSNAYEIGVIKKNDSYELEWDTWNNGYGLVDKAGKNMSLLKTSYSKHVVLNEIDPLLMEGYTLEEEIDTKTGDLILNLIK